MQELEVNKIKYENVEFMITANKQYESFRNFIEIVDFELKK